MAHTVQEYSWFNVPVDPFLDIPPEDLWLFDTPCKTYPIGTPTERIFREFAAIRDNRRFVGSSKILAKPELRVRQVHYSNYQRVPV